MSVKYYFYQTVSDKGRNKLRPLPGQAHEDGTALNAGLNCQTSAGGKRLRETYKIGTVFCSSMCQLSAVQGQPFYHVGDIYPIIPADLPQQYDFNLPTPTQEMLRQYDEFRGASGTVDEMRAIIDALALKGFSSSNRITQARLVKNLRDALRLGIVRFLYQKTDGTVRTAYGTLAQRHIPAAQRTTPTDEASQSKRDKSLTTYFDLGKDAWRTFRAESLLDFTRDYDTNPSDDEEEFQIDILPVSPQSRLQRI